ncbi:MAG: hypothetical protein VR74_01425 [Hyphomonas sp. BRH_c22]|uniref:hypothetical protein n=1 Tax=Hyphomonas sp. BRH_c22 TaxID=1629710 RepID=UPI0005F1AE87|nr:hypothetical protein [Hyphomonas sp. BRH_c22]KJS39613.1 MAG: hypothetical protein VR74_01425 [Hyphomonas sp. BRH_c22]
MRLDKMRLNAPRGQQVIYLEQTRAPWGGTDPRGLLEPGARYTVNRTIVGRSLSFVELAEHPDDQFNSVMFEESSPILPAVQTVEEIYNANLLSERIKTDYPESRDR